MAVINLDLKTREAFAELSLHDKNRYLQEVADRIMSARGEETFALDKDALARIRRYYSRRSMADLKLEEMGGSQLARAFKGIANGIRTGQVQKVLEHELPGRTPKGISRPAPLDDAQLMLFVPSIHDAPIKDDFNLMDIAPFALSKSPGQGVIRYELPDSIITIEGGAEVGIATAYDYDIVINMISHLAEATRRYLVDEERNLRPTLPAQIYRPSAAEILKFCRREQGGKQYEDLEAALDRLAATRIKITNLTKDDKKRERREAENFPLIGRYRVISHTNQGRIDQVEIEIPKWVYDGVVKPSGSKPTILTLNPDYFLITRPIAKFIYRLARTRAGKDFAFYSVTELHKRSGSKLPMRKFRQAIREIVEAAQTSPLPDYDLEIEERTRDMMLWMYNRKWRAEGGLVPDRFALAGR